MKCNRWEIAAMLSFFLLLAYGALAQHTTQQVSDEVVRLHVIANSDSAEDQQLKIQVRDAVLSVAEPLLRQAKDTRQCRAILTEHLQQLADVAQQTVYENGFTQPVSASYVHDYFPTKDYDTFSLPAGTYDGIRISLGEARGQNWWCVVFPSLCTSAVSDPLDQQKLPDRQRKFITRDGVEYEVRFQAADWLAELRHKITGR